MMSIDHAISLLVTITLIEMMVAIGMGVAWQDVVRVLRQGRLVTGALLANFVLVPLAAAALLLLYQPNPGTAAGILILAICPGAPFGPPIAAFAKSDVPVAVGLMTVLSASSAIISPLLLQGLLPIVAAGQPLRIDGGRLVMTLLVIQLIPLGAGIGIRHWRPRIASGWLGFANQIGTALNLLSVGAILGTRYRELSAIRWQGFLGMTLLLAASACAGWLLGGHGTATRRTAALTTALRNIGLSLVIATSSSMDDATSTAVVAYGLFGIAGSFLLGGFWRWSTPSLGAIAESRGNRPQGMVGEGARITTSPNGITEVRP